MKIISFFVCKFKINYFIKQNFYVSTIHSLILVNKNKYEIFRLRYTPLKMTFKEIALISGYTLRVNRLQNIIINIVEKNHIILFKNIDYKTK